MASKECHGRPKPSESSADHIAAIFGVTGLVGKEIARRLTPSWKKVYGIARNNPGDPTTKSFVDRPNFHFIQCDLQNAAEAQRKLAASLEDVTHVFWVTWASQSHYDSKACRDQNKAMMSNALDALLPRAKALRHVSLQTGLKHYIPLQGPFGDEQEIAGKYFDEECPRVVTEIGNFYYDLEDLVRERLTAMRQESAAAVGWSVHRPGLLFGSSCRAFYNFIGSLGVYGTICRRLKLPFVFGGTRRCWEEFFLDGSDARLVAEQHIWAATDVEAAPACSIEGQAFNAVNGDGFAWKEIWSVIGEKVVGAGECEFSEEFRYSEAMAEMGSVWEEIVEKEGLVRTKIGDLANWEFLDLLFRCPVKLLGTRDKADRLGFTVRFNTLDSVLYWLDSMRNDKLIP